MATSTILNSSLTPNTSDSWVRVTEYIGYYYPAIYCLIGVPFNLANIAFLRNHWKKSSHYVYVIVLSVVDSLLLTHRAVSAYVPSTSIPLTTGGCAWTQFIIQTSSQMSSWTLVLMCCERAIVVKFPFSRLTFFTCKRAIVSTIVTAIIIIILNSVVFFSVKANVIGENIQFCAYREEYYPLMRNVLFKLEAFVYVLIPFVLLVITNAIIIVTLYQSRGLRGRVKSRQEDGVKFKLCHRMSNSGSWYSSERKVTRTSVEKDYHSSHSRSSSVSKRMLSSVVGNEDMNTNYIGHTLAKEFKELNDAPNQDFQNPKFSRRFVLVLQKKTKKMKRKRIKTIRWSVYDRPEGVILQSAPKSKSELEIELEYSTTGSTSLHSSRHPSLTNDNYDSLSETSRRIKKLTPANSSRHKRENIQLKNIQCTRETCQCSNKSFKSTRLATLGKLSKSHSSSFENNTKSVTNLPKDIHAREKYPIHSQIFPRFNNFNHLLPGSNSSPLYSNRQESKEIKDTLFSNKYETNQNKTVSRHCNTTSDFNQIWKSAVIASMVFFVTTAPYCVISIFVNFIYFPGSNNDNSSFICFLMTFSVAMCDFNHVVNLFIYSMKSIRLGFSSFKTFTLKTAGNSFKSSLVGCRRSSFMAMVKKSTSGSAGSSGLSQSQDTIRAHL